MKILIIVGILLLPLAFVVKAQTEDAEQTLEFGGIKRVYRVHVPTVYNKEIPAPLVFVLHGGGSTGKPMDKLTGLNALADKKGFFVVYPDGFEKSWNDGRKTVKNPKIDDVGFISALIDHIAKTYAIDRKRVYSSGISNGGMMSSRLACELSDKIAAIATVAGNLNADIAPNCKPKTPIPVLIMHGIGDTIVPFAGGAVFTFGGQGQGGNVLSVQSALQFWAENNACSPKPQTVDFDADPKDGTKVRRDLFTGCKHNADVAVYSITNGGHTWPGGWQYAAESFVGKTTRDINGSEIIWDFFSNKSLK